LLANTLVSAKVLHFFEEHVVAFDVSVKLGRIFIFAFSAAAKVAGLGSGVGWCYMGFA
jgi:hypothetical protein